MALASGKRCDRITVAFVLLFMVIGCGSADSFEISKIGDGPSAQPALCNCKGVCLGDRCLLTLAADQNTPHGIAVDAESVYFTSGYREVGSRDRGIKKVPVDGGPIATLASHQDYPFAIAIDETSVYWVNYGGAPGAGAVMKVPVEGGTPEALADGQNPSDIAVAGGAVYFVASDEDRGAIRKMPVSGGPVVKLVEGWQVSSIAAAAGVLYWADGDPLGTQKAGVAGVVMKSGLDGSGSTQLFSGPSGLLAIVVDSANLYFVTGGTFNESTSDGVVGRTPLAGGAPTILASNQSHPTALAVDGESIYWTTEGTVGPDGEFNADGTIMKVPISGGTPTVLASGQLGPRAIAVDDTSVYWTTYGATGLDGTVMKLTPK